MNRLSGRVVATTRDGAPDDPLTRLLEAEGARVVEWPTLSFGAPSDEALARARSGLRAGDYDWVVVTSARAVPSLGDGAGVPAHVRVAAVGAATASALRDAGWEVSITGDGDAADLAAAWTGAHDLGGARVLFPAASMAGDVLEGALTAEGARVDRVEAYRTVLTPPDGARVKADLAVGVDVITFASPSAVRSLATALQDAWPDVLAGVGMASIGPSTERALCDAGLGAERIATAARPGLEGLVDACVASLGTKQRG